MESSIREKKITQTSVIGIVANVFLAAFKAVIGIIAGSIAIVLDAVNNLTDAMSSIITIIGVNLAKKRPDIKHPYGYGRIEYFSAIIISVIILSAGVTSFIESAKKIISLEKPDFSYVSLIIIAVAVVVKLILGKYVKSVGKKYNSDALVASGSDASFDAIISSATLVGAVVTMIFGITVDGILGVVISIFIIKAGISTLLESTGKVIGSRADSEITKEIRETVTGVSGVLGAYDLIIHNYGPDAAIGSIHIEVSDTLNASDIHIITKQIQQKVLEKFHIFLTVGIYALDSAHAAEREVIKEIALKQSGVIETHGIFFNEKKKSVSFDVLIDFTVSNRQELCQSISEKVLSKTGYTAEVNFDTFYSD